MDHTVVHFEIPADEPERAAKFYRELFGWEISRWGDAAGGSEGPEYWMVRTIPADAEGQPARPGVNGGLMRRMMPGQTPVNYIGVASVDEFVRRAARLGATVVVPKRAVPGMGWFAQLSDTEGNVFAIWQNDGPPPEPAPRHVAGRPYHVLQHAPIGTRARCVNMRIEDWLRASDTAGACPTPFRGGKHAC